MRLLRLAEDVRRRYDPSSIRFVASTGSPCPPDVKRAMGPGGPGSLWCARARLHDAAGQRRRIAQAGSAGRPLPGVSLRILDRDGHAMAQGTAGLIYVRQPAFSDFSYIANDQARQAMERDGHMTCRADLVLTR